MRRLLGVLSLALGAVQASAQSSLSVVSIEPTVLFPNAQPLRQITLVRVQNTASAPVECVVQAAMAGSSTSTPAVVQPGSSVLRVPVPDIDARQHLSVEIRSKDGSVILGRAEREWTPQRKWKVYLVASSHRDLGYEDFIQKEQGEFAGYIDIARRLTDPAHGDFRYTMENLISMHNYIDERSESAWRDLVDERVKTGRMPIMGAPSGLHSHWADYEELARMAYPARREAVDRFGLDIKTFMIADNPSLSWSGVEVLADAGFRYVARWGQGWRTGDNNDYAHTKLPALFWWQAPDKVHKLLFAWRSHYGLSFWYGQQESGYGPALADLGSENVDTELKSVEDGTKLGPYPYDALIVPSYVDFGVPHVDARALPEWRKRYAYPEIRTSDPTDFFTYMERRYGSELPTLTGDLNNFSADYATIDPESQGWKRSAARALPAAQGLAALDSYLSVGTTPIGARVSAVWDEILQYDEHTWPTQPQATDFHVFNATWSKKQGAARAWRDASEFLRNSLSSLAASIRTDEKQIVVFNSLSHARDGLVDYAGQCAAVQDMVTLVVVPCEQSSGKNSRFPARDVPAFGYKLFRAVPETASEAKQLHADAHTLQNEYYTLHFDPVTGNIVSIFDRKMQRELVESSGKYQLNQMVYVHRNGSTSKEGFEYSPSRATRMASSRGKFSVSFDTWTDDAKTGAAIRQTITLYDGLPQIDIVDRIEHASVMFSTNYADRYRENIFFAFPFRVPGGQPRAEYPGGVVRPYLDQLRWGSHDYLSANRWVDVSNSKFGVTLASFEAPIFHFGAIRYNNFSIDARPEGSGVFSYAWSNRMAGLLTLGPEECNATFHYSLTTHSGDWDSGRTTSFGWSMASPMLAAETGPNPQGALPGPQQSFLSVDAPNVQMTVFKESEQPGKGWVVRLVETEGKAATFTLKSALLPVKRVFRADLVENMSEALPVHDGEVRASVAPFGFVTLMLQSDPAPQQPIQPLIVETLTGEASVLRWAPAAAGLRYMVFRSTDPRSPATEYSQVGLTSGTEFRDTGLDPGTRYFYRVLPLTRGNMSGPLSEKVQVTTAVAVSQPPAPVRDLSIVRLPGSRLIVSWRKSPEQNAARYYLYRDEDGANVAVSEEPLAVLPRSGQFLETFTDKSVSPGHTYTYRVLPENMAALRQTQSPTVTGTAPMH